MVVDKFMLDIAWKDKNNKVFSKEFRVEVHYLNSE